MNAARPLAVALTPLETRRDVALHVAKRAEELGYARFSLAEGWGHDAGALLVEVATRTQRIGLATGVLNIWGRSAAGIAMLAATLDEVSGGRFTLGLGAGSPALAEGLHDVSFRNPVARLESVTRQVRALLRGERTAPTVSVDTRGLRLAVAPRDEVQVYLAALGDRAVRVCGRLADGWFPFLLPRSGMEQGQRMLHAGFEERGDAGGHAPRVCPCIPAAVSQDPAVARDLAAWWITFYLGSMGPLYRDTLTRLGHGDAVAAVLAANPTARTRELPAAADTLLGELTLGGSPDEARGTLDRWYAAGADMPCVALPPGREVAELDEILEALAPGAT